MLRCLKDQLQNIFSYNIDIPNSQEYISPEKHTFNPLQKGLNLSKATFHAFYKPNQFCTPLNEADTITIGAHQYGYFVWHVSIEAWALANATLRSGPRGSPRHITASSALRKGFDAMNLYWSPEYSGYCAWHNSVGNRDIYYDDNAHCGNALIYAFEATGDAIYLNRAREIANGILTRGWDSKGKPGGMPWHIDKNESRNACSTLSSAMFCARLALHNIPERSHCLLIASSCIQFSESHLIASDGLVLDNYHPDDKGGGGWTHDHTKFTYNTGFGIAAFLFWAKASGDMSYVEKATKLALKSIDSNCVLFDQTVRDPDIENRMWWDFTYFAHHLVEALVLVAKHHGEGSEVAMRITRFVARFAAWCHTWIRDESDGMYFRNLRPYLIDEERTRLFNEKFGTEKKFDWQADEHERDGEKMLVKGMVAQASMVNIMLYASASSCRRYCVDWTVFISSWRTSYFDEGTGTCKRIYTGS